MAKSDSFIERMFRRGSGAGEGSRCRRAADDPPRDARTALDRRHEHMLREIAADAREVAASIGRSALSPRVMEAMRRVKRDRFLPASERDVAYVNQALAIGYGQTISQPFIVALMTELLDVSPDDVVLEIGTGSGYQSAVLAELAREVYTVECVEALADAAERRLGMLGYENVHVRAGDGCEGWAEHAPYDGIIVTAATPFVPPALLGQLKPCRPLVIPIGPAHDTQWLSVLETDEAGVLTERRLLAVRFVPLT